MPKETFLNLSAEKQEQFIKTALQEFAYKDFQNASITQIVKNMGIAKGSVYQYFEDKLALFLYLKQYAEAKKMQYIITVNRANYEDFWEYFKALFINGLTFDLEEPLCSLFLFRIGYKDTSPQVQEFVAGWKEQARIFMTILVAQEQKNGTIRTDLAINVIVHFLITMSMSVAELLQNPPYSVHFEENIEKGKPLFGANKTELVAAVDSLIALMKNALMPIYHK